MLRCSIEASLWLEFFSVNPAEAVASLGKTEPAGRFVASHLRQEDRFSFANVKKHHGNFLTWQLGKLKAGAIVHAQCALVPGDRAIRDSQAHYEHYERSKIA